MIPCLRTWLFAGLLTLMSSLPAGASAAVVDINKASQAELETVKGIGPAMSTKILTARKSGDFKSWDDLMQRVSGMGPGNARRMSQAGLRVSGSAFQSHTAAAPKPKTAREGHAARLPKGTTNEQASRSRGDGNRAQSGAAAAAPGSPG